MDYTVKLYQRSNGLVPFLFWLESLDLKTKLRVRSRIRRLSLGHWGDYKYVSGNVFELRLFCGSGYRVYCSKINKDIVLILCAGDKKTQTKDIKRANEYLKDYFGD